MFSVLNFNGSPTPYGSSYAPSPNPGLSDLDTLPKLALSVTVQVTDLVTSAGNSL